MKFCLYVATLLLGATCTFASEHLTFELGGVTHDEIVHTDGNLVELDDEADNFIVVLDYDRDLLTIKITTTPEVCYFGTLSNTPFNRDNTEPVFVTEDDDQVYEEGTVFSVVKGDPIDFKDLTDHGRINELCSGVPSFELVQTGVTHTRSARRAPEEDGVVIIIHVIVIKEEKAQ